MSVEYLGQSGHASDPGLGNNALDGMYQFMTALYAYRDKIQQQYNDPAFTIPTPTMNLGHIHGGDNSNRICGACTLLIDIRFLPAMSFETLHTDLEQLAFEVADKRGLDVATQIFGLRPARDGHFRGQRNRAVPDPHHRQEKTGSVAFGTEAPYYNSMQTETIVIGPGSINQAHQPDEFLPLAHIDPTIKMLEDLIDRFCIS